MKNHLSYCSLDRQNRAEILARISWIEGLRTKFEASLALPVIPCPQCDHAWTGLGKCPRCSFQCEHPDSSPIPSVPESLKMSDRTYDKRKCAIPWCSTTFQKNAPNHKLCPFHCDAKVRRGRAARMVAPHSGSRKVKR